MTDVWFSLKLTDRYSYHWERRAIDGTIYRHDNAPHRRWESVSTFPKHFHEGSEDNVTESYLSENPEEALREFLAFAREILERYTEMHVLMSAPDLTDAESAAVAELV